MLNELIERYPSLKVCKGDIEKAISLLTDCYERGGKLLLCGNGGSCADCEHIAGELMKGFMNKRPLSSEQKSEMQGRCDSISSDTLEKLQSALPAIPITSFSALNTAFSNDVEPSLIYAQSVLALGKSGDVLLTISTSGNSKNVVEAARVAKGLGLGVIVLTGVGGGMLAGLADVTIRVPESETYKVQELHLPVYHYICAAIEKQFFG